MQRPKRYDYTQYVAWRLSTGQFHRRGKPALIWADGRVEWAAYQYGVIRNTVKYCNVIKLTKQQTVLMLLKYGDILPTHVNDCDEEIKQFWRTKWNAQ